MFYLGLQFNIKTKNVWQGLLALCTHQLYNFILFDNWCLLRLTMKNILTPWFCWRIIFNAQLFAGFRGSVDANGFPVGQYPEIRGTGYVESNDPVQVGGGAPQQRVFRNSQPATPPPNYGVSPSYQARQYEEQLYNFQNFNGQYYGANGKKWRWTPLLLHINKTVII